MVQKRTEMTVKYRKANQPYDIDIIPVHKLPTKTTRVINKFVLFALVLIAISLGVFLKWSFEFSSPLVVKNSPFPTRTVPPNASANDVIILDIDYCKNTDKQANVRASYVSDTSEIFMPITKEQYSKGCFRQNVPIIIPKDLPSDTYKIKFTATYNLNPIKQNVQVVFESRRFNISDGNESTITHE